MEDELYTRYIDQTKSEEREKALLQNIQENTVFGTNVILTGAGHLNFFQKHFPDAIFPYRKKAADN